MAKIIKTIGKIKTSYLALILLISAVIVLSFFFLLQQEFFYNKDFSFSFVQYTAAPRDDGGSIISGWPSAGIYNNIVNLTLLKHNYLFDTQWGDCNQEVYGKTYSGCCEIVRVYKDNSLIDTLNAIPNLAFGGQPSKVYDGIKIDVFTAKQWNGHCVYVRNDYSILTNTSFLTLEIENTTIKQIPGQDINITLKIANSLQNNLVSNIKISVQYNNVNGLITKEYTRQITLPYDTTYVTFTLPSSDVEEYFKVKPSIDSKYSTAEIQGGILSAEDRRLISSIGTIDLTVLEGDYINFTLIGENEKLYYRYNNASNTCSEAKLLPTDKTDNDYLIKNDCIAQITIANNTNTHNNSNTQNSTNNINNSNITNTNYCWKIRSILLQQNFIGEDSSCYNSTSTAVCSQDSYPTESSCVKAYQDLKNQNWFYKLISEYLVYFEIFAASLSIIISGAYIYNKFLKK